MGEKKPAKARGRRHGEKRQKSRYMEEGERIKEGMKVKEVKKEIPYTGFNKRRPNESGK